MGSLPRNHKMMNKSNTFNRRSFIYASMATLSWIYIPGIGKIQASPSLPEPGDDYFGRLCYNENPLGPSPLALNVMKETAEDANRYPDPFCEDLEAMIAEELDLYPGNICAGNGATEIIRLIADAFLFSGDNLVTADPTYFQMAAEATTNGATVTYVPIDDNHVIDLDETLDAIDAKTKMVSLVNPNNPLGTIIPKQQMAAFLDRVPSGVVVVIDEAYHHYASSNQYESCMKCIKDGLPVIVIRTFSKVYGLAGARIGYAAGATGYIGQISSRQLFATVSGMGQAAAMAALNDDDHVEQTISLNQEARAYLETEVEKMGLAFIPSETNFMMIDVGRHAGPVVTNLANLGYQVSTGWGMPEHIRVSTGTMEEMKGFITALKDVLNIDSVEEQESVAFGLLSISPNPVAGKCEMKFYIPRQGLVRIIVFDLTGNVVAMPANIKLPSGKHSIIWDGLGSNGKKLSPGIYTVLLLQGELASSRKLSVVH
jgi:histidinol-phosphate aminotransferase